MREEGLGVGKADKRGIKSQRKKSVTTGNRYPYPVAKKKIGLNSGSKTKTTGKTPRPSRRGKEENDTLPGGVEGARSIGREGQERPQREKEERNS